MAEALSAGDALVLAGFDVAAVRRELASVEPYAVEIRPAPRWLQAMWARGIAALATPWGVFVREPVLSRLRQGAEPARDGRLVVHELTHLEQFNRLGAFRHLGQYLGDYLRGRWRRLGHWEAYRQVRLEVEAREVASRFHPTGSAR